MPKPIKKRKVLCECGALVSPGSVFCVNCKKIVMEKNRKCLDTTPIPDLFTLVSRRN